VDLAYAKKQKKEVVKRQDVLYGKVSSTLCHYASPPLTSSVFFPFPNSSGNLGSVANLPCDPVTNPACSPVPGSFAFQAREEMIREGLH
jgi:hypothetical protein